MTIEKSRLTELLEQDKRHHLHSSTNPVTLRKTGPEMIARAEGVYLYTPDGRQILDACSSLLNVQLGYGNRRLIEAASNAMQELSFCHTALGRSNPYAAALSAKLAQITPSQFQLFFFASSGSEANDSAIKMALHYWRLKGKPEKRMTISRRGSYHGSTLLTASVTGIDLFYPQFGLPIPGMTHHTDGTNWYREGKGRSKEAFYRDLVSTLEKEILEIGPERIAAFIGETLQTGNFIPEPLYWQGVRALCDRYDILLIADEVVNGFGKTGKMFAFEHFGFEPDFITMAKGITSGYFPLSAVAFGGKVAEVISSNDALLAHVFTNSGHPVGAAVALENLAIIEDEKLIERVRDDIGPYFRKRLEELLELPGVGEVRSLGVLGAVEIDLTKTGRAASPESMLAVDTVLRDAAWRRGLSLRAAAGLCLPMIITRSQIDDIIQMLKDSLVEALGGLG